MLTEMLGIDSRTARATWTIFLFILLLAFLYFVRQAILLFILAIFFAYMLSPVVDFVQRFLPRRMSRTLSLAMVYVVLIAVLITGGIWLGSHLVEEATSLATRLPDLLQQQAPVVNVFPFWLQPYVSTALDSVRQQIAAGAQNLMPLLKSAGVQIASIAGSLAFVVLVPILSFFFLKDGSSMRSAILEMAAGSEHERSIERFLDEMHTLMASYIRALFTLSVAASLTYFLFFEITGLQYAVLLAAIAAPLEFIPVLGPLAASVSIVLVSAFTGYPHIIWLIVFLATYRIFQDYVLQPFLMSSGVELHPLLIIFGAIAGEELAGVWGMVLSVPVIATLRLLVRRLL
jgi:predicted PurR-regulated permease PerM